jgi:hypothetical protein
LLAKDIQQYSPGTKLVILTDQPQHFHNYPQVLAFEHQQQGVKCYHDKRFVIAQALSLFDICIFMDSDMRILAQVPEEMPWLLVPGINTRACISFPAKYAKIAAGNATKEFYQQFKLVKKAIELLRLDAEWENIFFVHEYLFTVSKDNGKEIEFLREWNRLAAYFESQGFYDAEGNAIGLAASKVGMAVRWSEMPGIEFFNHKTEIIRIQQGQSQMEQMGKYFQEHDQILHSPQSAIAKIISKLNGKIQFFYRKLRLKMAGSSLLNPEHDSPRS